MSQPLVTRWPVHGQEEIAAVARVLASGRTNYWTGEEGRAFEGEWCRFVGLPHALAVSNGTTALEVALRGLELGAAPLGHDVAFQPQVIVPCRTFMATASAVVHAGGVPVLADIDPESLCVTAETLEAVRTGATVGVIVVHYAGLPAPGMDDIVRWAMRHGLWIIEDCAHAHGAPVGRQSHVATWSFCVGKNISTGGEGGMVACLDERVAGRMRAYRDHGRYQMTGKRMGAGEVGLAFEWTVEEFGSNLRMTEMQSVLGRYGLRRLAGEVARRREIAARYDAVLGEMAMHTEAQRAVHARYMYLVQHEDRDWVMRELVRLGIPVRMGGCPDIGGEEAFKRRGWSQRPRPGAEEAGRRCMALPVYPTMSDDDVDRVCAALREVVG